MIPVSSGNLASRLRAASLNADEGQLRPDWPEAKTLAGETVFHKVS
jgi:hypothetical protein